MSSKEMVIMVFKGVMLEARFKAAARAFMNPGLVSPAEVRKSRESAAKPFDDLLPEAGHPDLVSIERRAVEDSAAAPVEERPIVLLARQEAVRDAIPSIEQYVTVVTGATDGQVSSKREQMTRAYGQGKEERGMTLALELLGLEMGRGRFDLRVAYGLADRYVKRREMEKALAFYAAVANKDIESGFFLKGAAVLRQITRGWPEKLSAGLQLAILHHQLGLVEQAINEYLDIAGEYAKRLDNANKRLVLLEVLDLDPTNRRAQTAI